MRISPVSLSFVVLASLFFAACGPSVALAPSSPLPRGVVDRHPDLPRAELSRDRARFAGLVHESAVTRAYDVESYTLKARFDWAQRALEAETEIVLERRAPGEGRIELDARMDEILSVTDVTNGSKSVYSWDQKAGLLAIDLPRSAGTRLALRVVSRTLADAGGALRAVPARRGDPLSSRVFYTHSEPFGSSRWFPSNDVPSDRARFRADLDVATGENAIANGRLLGVDDRAGRRVFHYATDYPIPTYVMAIAAGDLDYSSRPYDNGRFPIQIWHRRGLALDEAGLADVTARQIAHYESLLVPYPYEKYAIVLLPDFGGGEENVGITFMDETRVSHGSLDSDMLLMAHELGHQWFGDYITVRTWDDLWVKEGMATLLAGESSRPEEDARNSGRLYGHEFGAADGEAIRDPSLEPDEKYTSGPYDRAAWFYTQVRSIVGEAKFWGTWRKVLQENAFGVVGTEEILAAFRPALGDVLTNKARLALAAKRVPRLQVGGDASVLKLNVEDPEQALLAPFTFRWVSDENTIVERVLSVGQGIEIDVTKPGILVADPRDIHPDPATFIDHRDAAAESAYQANVARFFAPRNPVELKLLLASSPAAQQRATEIASPERAWALTPTSFAALWMGLDSQRARVSSLEIACRLAAASGSLSSDWRVALENAMQGLPSRGLVYARRLESCWAVVQPAPLQELFGLLTSDPTSARLDDKTVTLLSRFDLPADHSASVWGRFVFDAPNVRRKGLAAEGLQRGLQSATDASLREEILAIFRRLLSESRVNRVLKPALKSVVAAGDHSALASLLTITNDTDFVGEDLRVGAFCAGWKIADQGKAADWKSFRAAVEDSRFTGWGKSVIARPEACLE